MLQLQLQKCMLFLNFGSSPAREYIRQGVQPDKLSIQQFPASQIYPQANLNFVRFTLGFYFIEFTRLSILSKSHCVRDNNPKVIEIPMSINFSLYIAK